jgi:hypothetical protein
MCVALPAFATLVSILCTEYLRPAAVSWLASFFPPNSDQTAFLSNTDASLFYSNVVQNTINFAIWPVGFLLVFYKAGAIIGKGLKDNYPRMILYALAGGAVSSLVSYGIITASNGDLFGSEPASTWYAQFLIQMLQTSVSVTLIAFAGVYFGYLRSSKNTDKRSAVAADEAMPS